MTYPSDSDLQPPATGRGTFEPVQVRLGKYSFVSEAEQRVIAETMKVELYSRRASLLKELGSIKGYKYDQKKKQWYAANEYGSWVEAQEDLIPDSVLQLARDLETVNEEIEYIDDWVKGVKDRAKAGGGLAGGGSGEIADEVTPDDIVDRYVDLTKAMLDIYKKQQDYNINQMKEQRERILFSQKSPVEPWFNFTPAPLTDNYALPVQANVDALAPEVTTIGQQRAQAPSPGVWGTMASQLDTLRTQLYPGYAKGTRKKLRLSEKIAKGCMK